MFHDLQDGLRCNRGTDEPTTGVGTVTEVYTFGAPPSYERRIKQRVPCDCKSESQIIRDAPDIVLHSDLDILSLGRFTSF